MSISENEDLSQARSVREVSASFHAKSDRITELAKTTQLALEDFLDESKARIEQLEKHNSELQKAVDALRADIQAWRTKSGRLK